MPGQDCFVIRPGATYGGVQGFEYFEGISARAGGTPAPEPARRAPGLSSC